MKTRTKQEIIELLSSATTTDKALQERIDYTLQKCNEDLKSVTKTDLVALYKEVQATKEQPQVVETAPKKKTVKKTVKKASAETPKQAPKAPKQKSVEEVEDLATSKMFPNTLEIKDFGKYSLVRGLKSFEELRQLIEDGQEFIFCFYWSKRLLQQFPYSNLVQAPKEFDNDLDVTTPIYISDGDTISYLLSMYTESIYAVKEEDFVEVDGIRFSGGIEYQIYKKVV